MKDIEKAVKKQQDGAFLTLFIIPNSKITLFPAGYNEWKKTIEIKVSSPAKQNRANMEVIKTLADFFNKKITDILIVNGDKSREKTVLIKNISKENVIFKLKESLDEY